MGRQGIARVRLREDGVVAEESNHAFEHSGVESDLAVMWKGLSAGR